MWLACSRLERWSVAILEDSEALPDGDVPDKQLTQEDTAFIATQFRSEGFALLKGALVVPAEARSLRFSLLRN